MWRFSSTPLTFRPIHIRDNLSSRADDESNVFPAWLRMCPILSFSLSLFSWGRTSDAVQILWSFHKSPPPRRLGFPRAFIIARPVRSEWIKTRRESEVAGRSRDNVSAGEGGREWRNKRNPSELIVLRREIVLSREILREIRDNFLGLWLDPM